MAIPLLETCDIAGRDLTADALLTQRALADTIVAHHAHYHFTVKDNQKTLAETSARTSRSETSRIMSNRCRARTAASNNDGSVARAR